MEGVNVGINHYFQLLFLQHTTQHTVYTQAHNTTACRGGAAAGGRGGAVPAVRSASAQTEVTLRHASTGHRGCRGQYSAQPGGHFVSWSSQRL